MSEKETLLDKTQYLTFHLAGEEYAVGILQVKEIITFGALTKVPQTPPSIRGVINLRGNVVPVVDLALKFGMVPGPVTDRTCIVIVEVDSDEERTVMGVIADSVSQVIDLLPGDILPPPAFGTTVRVDFLRGMGRTGAKFVLILDINKVLSSADFRAAAATENAKSAYQTIEDATSPARSPE